MHNDTTTSRTVQTQQGTTSIKCMVTKTGMQLRYSRRYIISYPFFASVVKSIPKPQGDNKKKDRQHNSNEQASNRFRNYVVTNMD
jgi:hypothetical protein